MMEWAARKALRPLQQEKNEFIRRNDFLGAVKNYNDYLGKYAWTLASGDARADRDYLEDELVKTKLAEARKEDDTGDPYAALAIVDSVLEVARGDGAVSKMREARLSFEDHRRRVEKQHLEEAAVILKEDAVDRVKAMNKALAIPALRVLLGDKNKRAIRKAAVEALGDMPKVHESTAILIEALAEEWPSGDLKGDIEAILKKRAKREFLSPHEWEAWYLAERCQAKKGRPYQGLVSESSPGKIEWRIVNISQETQKLDLGFGPVFRVTTVDGKELPLSFHFDAHKSRRGVTATLKSGQFVGGSADLKNLVDLTDARGPVRVTWSLKLDEGEGEEGKITTLPIRMEANK
jgi:hypothetical protein